MSAKPASSYRIVVRVSYHGRPHHLDARIHELALELRDLVHQRKTDLCKCDGGRGEAISKALIGRKQTPQHIANRVASFKRRKAERIAA